MVKYICPYIFRDEGYLKSIEPLMDVFIVSKFRYFIECFASCESKVQQLSFNVIKQFRDV